MNQKIRYRTPLKGKIAIGFSLLCLVAICSIFCWIAYMHHQATNITPSGTEEIATIVDDEGTEWPVIDWAYWKSINPDVIGWVTIPGLGIDYPIVQAHADDPEYYLHYDIYGNWNFMGCPYLSPDCEEQGLKSYNSVIYGHNIGHSDSSMFAPLSWMSDPQTAAENPYILLQTPDWKDKLDIEAVDVINGWNSLKQTDFATDELFKNYHLQRYNDASLKTIDEQTVVRAPRMYTFCTCSYNYWSNERTLVFAE